MSPVDSEFLGTKAVRLEVQVEDLSHPLLVTKLPAQVGTYCTISINSSQFWNSRSSEILFRFMAIFDDEFFQPCDL